MITWPARKTRRYIVRRSIYRPSGGKRGSGWLHWESRRSTKNYYHANETQWPWLKFTVIVCLVTGVSLGILYGSSSYMTLRNVEIENKQDPQLDQLERTARIYLTERRLGLPRGHVLRYRDDTFAQYLLTIFNYPALTAHRLNLSTVRISQTPAQATYLLLGGNGSYELDQRGRRIENSQARPRGALVASMALIEIKTVSDLSELPPWFVDRIQEFQSVIGRLYQDAGLIRYEIEAGSLERVRIYTPRGWYILANSNQKGTDLAERLRLLMGNEFKKKEPKEYVDLRFEDKAIYK